MRFFSLFLLLSVLEGCFAPGVKSAMFKCADSEAGSCPDNQVCFAGLCYYLGDVPAASAGDQATSAPTDQAEPSGCASGRGTPLGSGYACPGSFNPGQVAAQCAAGYAPCTTAAGLNLTACANLEGFYLAAVVGRYATAGDLSGLQCSGTDYYRAVFGCGNPVKAKPAATACSSFTRLIDCRDINADFRCPPPPFEGIENMTNPYPLDGVLCCKKP